MARECPKCMAAMPARARFCPRCGRNAADVPDAADAPADRRRAAQEAIVGWIFFVVGGLLVLTGLLGPTSGGRAWMSFGFGIALAVVGLGCLVGNDDGKTARKREKRRRKKDEKDRAD